MSLVTTARLPGEHEGDGNNSKTKTNKTDIENLNRSRKQIQNEKQKISCIPHLISQMQAQLQQKSSLSTSNRAWKLISNRFGMSDRHLNLKNKQHISKKNNKSSNNNIKTTLKIE
jgi:hypothetical protein